MICNQALYLHKYLKPLRNSLFSLWMRTGWLECFFIALAAWELRAYCRKLLQ